MQATTGSPIPLCRALVLLTALACARAGFAQTLGPPVLQPPATPAPAAPGALAPLPVPVAPAAPAPPLPAPSLPPLVVPAPAPQVEPPLSPLRVGQIFIQGNDRTKDDVIRRQLIFAGLLQGQVLQTPDLREAERNLARLGIFEVDPQTGVRPTVTVIEPPSGIATDFRDILVRVQEEPTASLLFGLNVNSDLGLSGSLVYNERNFDILGWPATFDDLISGRAFRGAGEEFRAEATPGTEEQRYAVTFRQPFLFDSPYFFEAGGYFYQLALHNEYTESRLGTRLTLGRQFGSRWRVEETVRLEEVDISHIPFDAPPQIWEDVGDHFLAGFATRVIYDARDSSLRTTEGYRVSFSAEPVTGDYTFVKLLLNAEKYWTLYQRADGSGRHVLSLNTSLGYASSETPVFERFFAGGEGSLRGFAFRGVGPSVAGFEVGGDFEFLNRLEYQLPILANDYLYGVAFLDTGTVEPSVEIRDYRVAAGAGLRIAWPPLGPIPIALDVAFPIVKGPGDHEQVFGFWIGFYH
jgi:outer membrane protein insertion porin family